MSLPAGRKIYALWRRGKAPPCFSPESLHAVADKPILVSLIAHLEQIKPKTGRDLLTQGKLRMSAGSLLAKFVALPDVLRMPRGEQKAELELLTSLLKTGISNDLFEENVEPSIALRRDSSAFTAESVTALQLIRWLRRLAEADVLHQHQPLSELEVAGRLVFNLITGSAVLRSPVLLSVLDALSLPIRALLTFHYVDVWHVDPHKGHLSLKRVVFDAYSAAFAIQDGLAVSAALHAADRNTYAARYSYLEKVWAAYRDRILPKENGRDLPKEEKRPSFGALLRAARKFFELRITPCLSSVAACYYSPSSIPENSLRLVFGKGPIVQPGVPHFADVLVDEGRPCEVVTLSSSFQPVLAARNDADTERALKQIVENATTTAEERILAEWGTHHLLTGPGKVGKRGAAVRNDVRILGPTIQTLFQGRDLKGIDEPQAKILERFLLARVITWTGAAKTVLMVWRFVDYVRTANGLPVRPRPQRKRLPAAGVVVPAQLEVLCEALEGSDGALPDAELRDTASAAARGGAISCRPAEIIGAPRGDWHPEGEGRLRIRARKRSIKSISAKRDVMPQLLRPHLLRSKLKQWLEPSHGQNIHALDEPLFKWRNGEVQPRSVVPVINRLLRRLTGDPSARFYWLRHSFANWLFAAAILDYFEAWEAAGRLGPLGEAARAYRGWSRELMAHPDYLSNVIVVVSALMGHLTPATTFRHYIHIAELVIAVVLAKMVPPKPEVLQKLANVEGSTYYRCLREGPHAFVNQIEKRFPGRVVRDDQSTFSPPSVIAESCCQLYRDLVVLNEHLLGVRPADRSSSVAPPDARERANLLATLRTDKFDHEAPRHVMQFTQHGYAPNLPDWSDRGNMACLELEGAMRTDAVEVAWAVTFAAFNLRSTRGWVSFDSFEDAKRFRAFLLMIGRDRKSIRWGIGDKVLEGSFPRQTPHGKGKFWISLAPATGDKYRKVAGHVWAWTMLYVSGKAER